MRHPLRLLLIAITVAVASSTDAASQVFRPFFLHEGYATAYEKAQDTLAADAYLVFSGTFGNLDLSEFNIPVTLHFYQDSETPTGLPVEPGEADAWGYVFYSPSLGRTVSLVVLNSIVLGGYAALGVPVDLPLPSQLVDTLDLGVPGTHSDALITRLRTDATYTTYHAQYPEKEPNIVTLGVALPDEVAPPDDFELGGPIWSLTYRGSGDTMTMICLVNATSGATACRTSTPSSVTGEPDATGGITLRALPLPASSHVRIVVDDVAAVRGEVSMELLDVAGRRIVDLGESLAENGFVSAVFDASDLAEGVYFCRLVVDGRSSTISVPVAHE